MLQSENVKDKIEGHIWKRSLKKITENLNYILGWETLAHYQGR